MARAAPDPRGSDPLGRLLAIGVATVVVAAPLPFGSVGSLGRLAFEIGVLLLTGIWLVRTLSRPTLLPPLAARAGLAGLLLLGIFQLMPVGAIVVSIVSPRASALREGLRPGQEVLKTEERLLGIDPSLLDPPEAISLDPLAAASALRTGAALVGLLLVSVTVASMRGVRHLALAFLFSAAFQGLYGTLVLASGHDHIWHLPKRYNLDAATGTFVNKNHFAGYLAAALPVGLALMIELARSRSPAREARKRVVEFFSSQGSRTLMMGLLLVLGLAGLLLSFSRAGIALGVGAILLTLLSSGGRRPGTKLVVGMLILAAGVVPLLEIGSARLVDRYTSTTEELSASGGRVTVWRDTLSMARSFPVAGVGFGAFASAYPLFRSGEVRLRFEHAHNDALQALAEGGLAGAAFLSLLLAPVLRRIVTGLAGRGGPMAAGLAAGLLALLLHSLVDFNLHIPSNAATAAVLAGALLGIPWHDRS